MTRRKHRTINELPLFASDEDIGEAVLGFERRREFVAMASALQPVGFPRFNPFYKGRYVPAVRDFFEREYGSINGVHMVPDGKEGSFHSSRRQKHKPPMPLK